MRLPPAVVLAAVVGAATPAYGGARTMGVIFVDVGAEKNDEVRAKLIQDLVAQGCWARDDCGDGIGLRDDLPKGLTKQDLADAAKGGETSRTKVAKVARAESGDDWKHPAGYFWDFDGFLVYSKDAAKGHFTIITLDEEARVIGSVSGDSAAAAKRKWDRRGLLKKALKPLWQRFSP
jgi:hypothetical protein